MPWLFNLLLKAVRMSRFDEIRISNPGRILPIPSFDYLGVVLENYLSFGAKW